MSSYPSDPNAYGSESAFQRERAADASDTTPIAELLSGLIGDAQTLVRREIDLAKQEVAIEVNKAKQGAIVLGAGVGVAAVGGILLSFMLVYLLHEVLGLSQWLSYLIVGGIFTIVGVLLLQQGAKRMKTLDPVPRETIESVKEDIQWIKEQSPSDKT